MSKDNMKVILASGLGLVLGGVAGVFVLAPMLEKRKKNRAVKQKDEPKPKAKKATAEKPATVQRPVQGIMPQADQARPREVKAKRPAPVEKKRPTDDSFPLRPGSRGNRVKRLQVHLMRNYGGAEPVTGLYDQRTDRRVKRFMRTDEVTEEMYQKLELDKMVHDQRPRPMTRKR